MPEPSLYAVIKPAIEQSVCFQRCRTEQALDEHYPLDRFHSTILNLGPAAAWAPEQVEKLRRAFGAVVFDPFDVVFDEIDGTLLRGGAGSSEAAALHRALRRAALTCGVPLPLHNFWLHLSLAYKGAGRPRARIEPIGWQVEEFQLVLSDHGHTVLGRWPLVRRQYALAL